MLFIVVFSKSIVPGSGHGVSIPFHKHQVTVINLGIDFISDGG